MTLTLLSCTLGLSLSARAIKILFDRYFEENKYHVSNPHFSAEDFLCDRQHIK